MKFYDEYQTKSEKNIYFGNLQIKGNYQWGYISLPEYETIVIIPELKYLNRSFEDDLVEVLIFEYQNNDNKFLNSLSKITSEDTHILFGKIINNKSNHEHLKFSGVLNIVSKYTFGTTKKNVPIYQFLPYSNKYPSFYVPSNVNKGKQLTHNVYAYVQFKSWDVNSKYPTGMCQQIIGKLGDIQSDYQYILLNHDVIHKKYPTDLNIEQFDHADNRQDYRQYHTLSIDPPGCQDIDDAITIVSSWDHYLVQVHIADVSNFVLENSQLDNWAR